MPDLSNMSDSDLMAAIQAQQSGAPSAPEAAPQTGLSGMTNDQLMAAIANAKPTNPPVPGYVSNTATGDLVKDAGRYLGTAAVNVAAGADALPRTIAQGVDWVGARAGMNPGVEEKLASVPMPGHPNYSMFPDFQTARGLYFGGTGLPEYVPQSTLGKYGMAALTGGLAGLTGGPEAVVPSAAGSTTAQLGSELFPGHPLIGAMLGFIPGSWMGKAAVNAPQRVAQAVTNANPTEPYGAFTRQGLPTNLAGTSTGDLALQRAENLASRLPGSETAVAAARGNLYDSWQDRFNDVVNKIGTAATPTDAGTSLQTAAQKWLADFKTNTGQLWSDFYSKVPHNTPVLVGNYQGTLNNLLGTFPGASETAGVLRSPTIQALSDALGVDLKGGGTLPWEAVKNIRTAIGEKLENPTTVTDTSQAALRQLYGALTQDMKSGAAGVGSDALDAFNKANEATRSGHQVLENFLDPILKAASPEKAAQIALGEAKVGGTRLGGITSNLPGATGDVASYALRKAAQFNPDNSSSSPTALASALLGRQRQLAFSPEATSALFPNGLPSDVSDLANVGKAIQPFEKDAANSPTATHTMRGGPLRYLTALEFGREGRDLAGWPGFAAGAALGYMAPNIAGHAASVTALNPYLSALYGRAVPMEAQSPSLLARALIAPALGQQTPPALLAGPATSASSPRLSP